MTWTFVAFSESRHFVGDVDQTDCTPFCWSITLRMAWSSQIYWHRPYYGLSSIFPVADWKTERSSPNIRVQHHYTWLAKVNMYFWCTNSRHILPIGPKNRLCHGSEWIYNALNFSKYMLINHLNHCSSQANRYNKCLDKLVVKYDLKLVAGNFFTTEFQPCLVDYVATLDPKPDYVVRQNQKVNYPPYPGSRRSLIEHGDEVGKQSQTKNGKPIAAIRSSSGAYVPWRRPWNIVFSVFVSNIWLGFIQYFICPQKSK